VGGFHCSTTTTTTTIGCAQIIVITIETYVLFRLVTKYVTVLGLTNLEHFVDVVGGRSEKADKRIQKISFGFCDTIRLTGISQNLVESKEY
jgi:hypothetical protein